LGQRAVDCGWLVRYEAPWMKPAPFDYQAPATLQEAVLLLASQAEATVIAGGQSLMPVLAFRLAAPRLLVDLRRIPGLGEITVDANGTGLGAMVRWCEIEGHPGLATAHPLLREAVLHIAHYSIRNRGTVGGSLAHADPAAELPGVAVTCDGEITLVGPTGSRSVRAGEFFTGPLSTARQADEIITGLTLPYWPRDRRWAFREFARREGDFALAGVLLFYDEDNAGRTGNAHVGVIGACDRPHRLTRAEAELNGHMVDDDRIRRIATAAAEEVDPPDDIHADADYRRALVAVLVERALRAAAHRRATDAD
jgi:aerobic carbon-monoxide dehydrogenase medium subunit